MELISDELRKKGKFKSIEFIKKVVLEGYDGKSEMIFEFVFFREYELIFRF